MTNLEKIRAMSAEELAMVLNKIILECLLGCCENCLLRMEGRVCSLLTITEWLKSEVEE